MKKNQDLLLLISLSEQLWSNKIERKESQLGGEVLSKMKLNLGTAAIQLNSCLVTSGRRFLFACGSGHSCILRVSLDA